MELLSLNVDPHKVAVLIVPRSTFAKDVLALENCLDLVFLIMWLQILHIESLLNVFELDPICLH